MCWWITADVSKVTNTNARSKLGLTFSITSLILRHQRPVWELNLERRPSEHRAVATRIKRRVEVFESDEPVTSTNKSIAGKHKISSGVSGRHQIKLTIYLLTFLRIIIFLNNNIFKYIILILINRTVLDIRTLTDICNNERMSGHLILQLTRDLSKMKIHVYFNMIKAI